MGALPFTTEIPVRFQHCDPAGIVFYPRYFEMTNQTVEEWFERGLGLPFAELHGARRQGVPAVRIEADFAAPSRLGDALTFGLEVLEIGRSSFTLRVLAACGGEERLRARLVLVLIGLEGGRPVPLPDDLRAAIGRFRAAGTAAA